MFCLLLVSSGLLHKCSSANLLSDKQNRNRTGHTSFIFWRIWILLWLLICVQLALQPKVYKNPWSHIKGLTTMDIWRKTNQMAKRLKETRSVTVWLPGPSCAGVGDMRAGSTFLCISSHNRKCLTASPSQWLRFCFPPPGLAVFPRGVLLVDRDREDEQSFVTMPSPTPMSPMLDHPHTARRPWRPILLYRPFTHFLIGGVHV